MIGVATEEVIGRVPEGATADMDLAVPSAHLHGYLEYKNIALGAGAATGS